MANRMKIKKGDEVIVICGKDKNKKGKVLKSFPKARKVKVAGIALAKRHVKQNGSVPGQIMQKEMPIDVSNIAILDPKTGLATRIGYKFLEDGSKVRYAKSSGELIDK